MSVITYPVSMPDLKFSNFDMDCPEFGIMSSSAGGRFDFQEQVGGTVWKLKATTIDLDPDKFDDWEGFRASLYGNGTFKAVDPNHLRPRTYASDAAVTALTRAAGGAFDGTFSVTSAGGKKLSLSGLPAGFVFKVGDRISFSWLGRQSLVRFVTNETADGSGVVVDGLIAPWLLAGGTVPVTATCLSPWCEMKMLPNTWDGKRSDYMSPVSFEGVQV